MAVLTRVGSNAQIAGAGGTVDAAGNFSITIKDISQNLPTNGPENYDITIGAQNGPMPEAYGNVQVSIKRSFTNP
jgi:hypothetical protein